MSPARVKFCAALLALLLCAASSTLAQDALPEGRFDASRKRVDLLRVTLVDRDPAIAMDGEDLLRAVAIVTHEVVAPDAKGRASSVGVDGGQMVAQSDRGPLFTIQLIERSKGRAVLAWTMFRGDGKGQVDVDPIVARLKQVLAQPPDAANLEQIRKERDALRGKQTFLATLVRGQAAARKDGLNARLARFDAEREGLEIDLAAARARADALRDHMKRLEKEAQLKAEDDPIRAQLERVLKAREEELKRIKDMVAVAHASAQEVSSVEARVAEAEIQLLTRHEQVMRGDEKGDLLGRLANELAMLSIDEAEKEARLKHILQRLPQLNPKALDEKALEGIAEEYPSLLNEAGELPPLYYDLDKRLAELWKSELALLVSEVKVESGAATAPAQQ